MSIDIDELEALAKRVSLWGQAPTILELIARIREAEAREQALAAHVEALHRTLSPFAQAWLRREPGGEPGTKGYQRRLERALGIFYSNGNMDDCPLTGDHLREAARALNAPVDTTSLAQRDARIVADALGSLLPIAELCSPLYVVETIEVNIRELRHRQAEANT